jgi:AcrR family transcriptional regulator
MNKQIKTPGKRQQVMNAAVALFRQTHDVKKVSLESIARLAGVSPATIYNQFGNRENLVGEVIKILIRDNLERNRSIMGADLPFAQKITAIISGKLDMATELNGEVVKKLISQDPAISAFIDEIYNNEIRPLWLSMLADGKKQGYIDESLDEEALLIYLDALKAGFKLKQDALKTYARNPALIEQLTHIMFYGFLKKDINLFKKEGQ